MKRNWLAFLVFAFVLVVPASVLAANGPLEPLPNKITWDGKDYYLRMQGQNEIGKEGGPGFSYGGAYSAFKLLGQLGKEPYEIPKEVYELLKLDGERAQTIAKLKVGQLVDVEYHAGILAAGAPGAANTIDKYDALIQKLTALKGDPDPFVQRATKYYLAKIKNNYKASGPLAGDAGKSILAAFSETKTAKEYKLLATLDQFPDPRTTESFTVFAEKSLDATKAKMKPLADALRAQGYTVEYEHAIQGLKVAKGGASYAEVATVVARLDEAKNIANAEEIIQYANAAQRLGAFSSLTAKNLNIIKKFYDEYKSASVAERLAAQARMEKAINNFNDAIRAIGGKAFFEFSAADQKLHLVKEIGKLVTVKPIATFENASDVFKLLSSAPPEVGFVGRNINKFKNTAVGKFFWWAAGKIGDAGSWIGGKIPSSVKTVVKFPFKVAGKVFEYAATLIAQLVLAGVRVALNVYCAFAADNQIGKGTIYFTNQIEGIEGSWLQYTIRNDFHPIIACIEDFYSGKVEQGGALLNWTGKVFQFFDMSALVQDGSDWLYENVFDKMQFKTCEVAVYSAIKGETAKMDIGCSSGANALLLDKIGKLDDGDYVAFGRINTDDGAGEVVADDAKSNWESYSALGICKEELAFVQGLTSLKATETEEGNIKWSAWKDCVVKRGYIFGPVRFKIKNGKFATLGELNEVHSFDVFVRQASAKAGEKPFEAEARHSELYNLKKDDFELEFKDLPAQGLYFNMRPNIAGIESLPVSPSVHPWVDYSKQPKKPVDPSIKNPEMEYLLHNNIQTNSTSDYFLPFDDDKHYLIKKNADGSFSGCTKTAGDSCKVTIKGINKNSKDLAIKDLPDDFTFDIQAFSDTGGLENQLDVGEYIRFTISMMPGAELPEKPEAPTGEEKPFDWAKNPNDEPKRVVLTVTNTLISSGTMRICWKYPDGYHIPLGGDPDRYFENVYLEEPTTHEFQPVLAVEYGNKVLTTEITAKEKCYDAPTTAPSKEGELKPVASSGTTVVGILKTDYTTVTSDNLKRQTAVLSGYWKKLSVATKDLESGKTNTTYFFSVNAGKTEGLSHTVSLHLEPLPDTATAPIVYIGTENTALGLKLQEQFKIATTWSEKLVENATGKKVSKYKYYFTLKDIPSNVTEIQGNSAGAAIAMLTLSLLEDKAIRNDVGITGSLLVETDSTGNRFFRGTVGQVGSVPIKAKAASALGTKLGKQFKFLVPNGQADEIPTLPNLTKQQVGTVEEAFAEFISPDNKPSIGAPGTSDFYAVTYLAFGIASEIKGIIPKTGLVISQVIVSGKPPQPIIANSFSFDNSVPEKKPQPFSLQIEKLDTKKKLYLGVDISCDNWKAALEQGLQKYKAQGAPSDFAKRLEKYKKQVIGAWEDQEYVKSVTVAIGDALLETTKQVGGAVVDVVATAYDLGKTEWDQIKQHGFLNWLKGRPSAGKTEGLPSGITEFDFSKLQQTGEFPFTKISSKKGYMVDPQLLKDPAFWKIDSIDGQNPGNLKGASHDFYACQFGEDTTDKEKFVKTGEDHVLIRFGQASCSSLQDCLLQIDKEFMKLFYGS